MSQLAVPLSSIFSLLFAISLAVGAQLIFKYGAGKIPSWDGALVEWSMQIWRTGIPFALFMYFISAFFYIYALREIPLSIASPTIAVSYAVIVLLSAWLFHEPLTMSKIIGVLLIGAGVVSLWR